MKRSTYKVTRVCAVCNGTGEGRCLVKCHACNGSATRLFELYASDLEGATLITYQAPPLHPNDPSIRVAPRLLEGERRPFITAAEAHDAGMEMLAREEIVSYAVVGYDDFAKLTPGEVSVALWEQAELSRLRIEAFKSSERAPWEADEDMVALQAKCNEDQAKWDEYLAKEREMRKEYEGLDAWEDPDVVREDLIRIGMIKVDPYTGEEELTPKGLIRVQHALDDDKDSAWLRQMHAMVKKAIFLLEKAAQ